MDYREWEGRDGILGSKLIAISHINYVSQETMFPPPLETTLSLNSMPLKMVSVKMKESHPVRALCFLRFTQFIITGCVLAACMYACVYLYVVIYFVSY